jgi:hypothetical protein
VLVSVVVCDSGEGGGGQDGGREERRHGVGVGGGILVLISGPTAALPGSVLLRSKRSPPECSSMG